jgi:hypothetical protein
MAIIDYSTFVYLPANSNNYTLATARTPPS